MSKLLANCRGSVLKYQSGESILELLSIVVPCFNEEATIPIFYETVEKIKEQIPAKVEYCFVDDGSRDRTLPILRELNKKSGGGPFITGLFPVTLAKKQPFMRA